MTRPPVLVVSRRLERKDKPIDWVSEVHMSLLLEERLLPVVVPVVRRALPALGLYARGMAGLLLVEGGDIQPRRYGASAPAARLDEVDPIKDEIELFLLRRALRSGAPVLGICRGMQLMNVALGGTLHLDVMAEKKSALKHMDLEHYDAYRHPVAVLPGTPLARWYGRRSLRVNSYHHQGVRRLAPGLRAMAESPDGLVEAFHDPAHPYRVGLQFHPERMLPEYAGNRRVFAAFGRAVRAFARKSGPAPGP